MEARSVEIDTDDHSYIYQPNSHHSHPYHYHSSEPATTGLSHNTTQPHLSMKASGDVPGALSSNSPYSTHHTGNTGPLSSSSPISGGQSIIAPLLQNPSAVQPTTLPDGTSSSISIGSASNGVSHNAQRTSSERSTISAAMYNNRYQFCGVLGKKMKRLGAILNERNKLSNI